MQPAKLLILAFIPALVSGRRMSSSEPLVNLDEKLASDVEKNSNEASYTEMASDPNKDSNKASYTEVADPKNNSNKASFAQEDYDLGNHTEETSLESEELLNEGMLKDFKTDFKNAYDPHYQTYICDCGYKSGGAIEWRAHSHSFVKGLWTGNKPSNLAKGLAFVKEKTGIDEDATDDIDAEGAQDLKASYTDKQECLDNCYSKCSSSSYNPLSKYNMARCVKVNDFSCLVHKVRAHPFYQHSSTQTVYHSYLDPVLSGSDKMVLAFSSVGGYSKVNAAENCAVAAGFKNLAEYYELTGGPGAKDRQKRFEAAAMQRQSRTAEAGSMITGMSIFFFPWETAGTKWDYSAPFFQCILNADLRSNGQNRFKQAADWIVPSTVKDAECVCWKGCLEMGKENAFCRRLHVPKSGILGYMGVKPSSGVAPSDLGDQIEGGAPGWEHEDKRPKFPTQCHGIGKILQNQN